MENMVDTEFWKNKRVLVTGHAGFKGSWLCLWLATMQARILGYGHKTSSFNAIIPNLDQIVNFQHIDGDIRDVDQVHKTISDFQPEIVIHLAAQSLVIPSYENPADTYSTNVMGTLHVLEAIRQTGSVQAGLIISSDKCYKNTNSLWGMRETDPLGGNDPYSSSKACVEILTNSYRNSFFSDQSKQTTSIISARAGNVLGGGDWSKNRLIPDCIRSWQNKEEVIIRSPNAIRPWQHVLDVLSGYLLLIEKTVSDSTIQSGAWNFGPLPHEDKPVHWIVETISRLWGQDAAWSIQASPTYHEAPTLTVDSTKARKLLEWEPKLPLRDALQWTVKWYQQSFDPSTTMQNYSVQQIEQYQSL